MMRYPSNNEHGAANLVAWVLRNRAKNAAQEAALLSLASKVDEKLAQLKDELLNGAGAEYDSFKELQELIKNNKDSLDALRELAAGHVRYDASQGLTVSQQAQARANISAVSEDEVEELVSSAIPTAPKVGITETEEGVIVTVTDASGATSAEVLNGKDGDAGAVYTPFFDGDLLCFSNNGGLPNPPPKLVRGEPGEPASRARKGTRARKVTRASRARKVTRV